MYFFLAKQKKYRNYVKILPMNPSKAADLVIEYTFYALIFFVPIIFLPFTSELFEFNKMILVYLGTSIVITAWLFKSVSDKKFTFKRTPLDIPIALFLLANIASTIFSIDPHTSIFGYYGRWNGGLLSTFSYIILFYAFVNFFDKNKLINLLKILLLSSTVVAIYAVLQHPTPLFRNPDGSFRGVDAGFWQQDAESKAFSTLGHANWLAAFMAMILPFAFGFLLLSKKWWERALFSFLLIIYFLTFTFTYSRGGTLGLVACVFSLVIGLAVIFRNEIKKFTPKRDFAFLINGLRFPNIGFFVAIVLIGCSLIVFFFGNAFTSKGINFAAIQAPGDTQLAAAGSETGRIRLIVWKGAFDIFKHYPLFGSGVETFAYSYYQFRPAEHNYTTEWDFLYNKAHNEFVNYLATTGLFGLLTYLIFLITYGLLVLRYLNQKNDLWKKFLIVSASGGFIGYLVQNLFGFSVVPIALLFFLTPALFLVLAEKYLREQSLSLNFLAQPIFSVIAQSLTVLLGLIFVSITATMWLADVYYSKGLSASSYKDSYQYLRTATSLRPDEPLYRAHLGWASMQIALEEKGKARKEKIAESFDYLNAATTQSPNNISLWRIRLRALYDLAQVQEEYTSQLVETAEIVAELAPTEAEIQYNLGSMYVFAQDYKEAQTQLEKVTELKLDYLDSWKLLFQVDSELKDKRSQRKHFSVFKKHFPKEAKDDTFLETYGLR